MRQKIGWNIANQKVSCCNFFLYIKRCSLFTLGTHYITTMISFNSMSFVTITIYKIIFVLKYFLHKHLSRWSEIPSTIWSVTSERIHGPNQINNSTSVQLDIWQWTVESFAQKVFENKNNCKCWIKSKQLMILKIEASNTNWKKGKKKKRKNGKME